MFALIVITGPTAVGKTALTTEIARHYGVPVVNADSRQIYCELPIGTAAPTADEMLGVKHYFVGNKSITEYYNASMYEQEVLALIDSLTDKTSPPSPAPGTTTDILAVMSGGSMMYVDAVCNGIDDIPTIRDDIRSMMKQRLADEGLEALADELKRLDPDHWQTVDRQNPRRVVHALEICHQTGQSYTSFRTRTRKERPFKIVKIGLSRPREELYDRINRRVDRMMTEGLLQEAEQLFPHRHLNALNTVGYKELFEYMLGHCTLQEAVERIKGNTRRYARKQLTWLKRDPQIRWFGPDQQSDILRYIDAAVRQDSGQ